MEDKEIILGRNPVLEYLKSIRSDTVGEVYLLEHAHGKIIDTILSVARSKGIHIILKNKSFFHNLAPSSTHQGAALTIYRGRQGGSEPVSENDIISETVSNNGVLVLLDHITDPHNTGAIIRTAEAMGCRGVVYPKNNSAGITSTVIKASAGATAHIPTREITNVAAFIEKAKESGIWVIGTSDHGDYPLAEIKTIRPALLVIGSEGKGMKRLTEEKCDYVVSIPLKGAVSSLNASVAAGIVLYELMK